MVNESRITTYPGVELLQIQVPLIQSYLEVNCMPYKVKACDEETNERGTSAKFSMFNTDLGSQFRRLMTHRHQTETQTLPYVNYNSQPVRICCMTQGA